MSAIGIRLLTGPETVAYSARGQGHCDADACPNGCRYIAVYMKAARVERDLLCGDHAAAWAAKHRQPLHTAVAT